MPLLSFLGGPGQGGALLANLIAALALALLVQLLAWLVRRSLRQADGLWRRWLRHGWGEKSERRTWPQWESALFWVTLGSVLLLLAGSVGYSLTGRNFCQDLLDWLCTWSVAEALHWGSRWLGSALLVLLGVLANRWLGRQEQYWREHLPAWWTRSGSLAEGQQEVVRAARLARAGLFLALAWGVWGLLGQPALGARLLTLAGRLLGCLVLVHLVPPLVRMLSGPAADWGDLYFAHSRWRSYWEPVRELFPFGRRCLNFALYASALAWGLEILPWLRPLVGYGPKLALCAAIFLGCHLTIALVGVFLREALGLSDSELAPVDQRGLTLVPLVHSICKYVLYFGASVIMLGTLGVNTGPILAGAGLLGLAVGLGSQSLVSDLVSGFFILFEGHFLVGDYVEIGEASGRVEALSIRTTQIRDAQGKLHLIPNGEIRRVISSSKGYVNAIVEWKLPAEGDWEQLLEAMREAGQRLRQQHPREVLADTEIQGIVGLGPGEMTARAITRVKPGRHEFLANEYRRLLKQVLQERRLWLRPQAQAA